MKIWNRDDFVVSWVFPLGDISYSGMDSAFHSPFKGKSGFIEHGVQIGILQPLCLTWHYSILLNHSIILYLVAWLVCSRYWWISSFFFFFQKLQNRIGPTFHWFLWKQRNTCNFFAFHIMVAIGGVGNTCGCFLMILIDAYIRQ